MIRFHKDIANAFPTHCIEYYKIGTTLSFINITTRYQSKFIVNLKNTRRDMQILHEP